MSDTKPAFVPVAAACYVRVALPPGFVPHRLVFSGVPRLRVVRMLDAFEQELPVKHTVACFGGLVGFKTVDVVSVELPNSYELPEDCRTVELEPLDAAVHGAVFGAIRESLCPVCGHKWRGFGAGTTGRVCPLPGCPGVVGE